ncbi:RpiB/LacA/LacB family sugar-phosphate isomerase [Mycoplasmopsis lipophila]|uniref:RpiB/LacA/LacB family sugar-phosphate isomerase n=1 Tax=Mycoplasmopsis lipophila TaxID=2117 RepID=UPI0038735460
MNKKIIFGSDHGGAELKNKLIEYATTKGYQIEDLGPANSETPVSYALQGHKVANEVLKDKNNLGVALCGTGLGISYALNRHKGIRAARCTSIEDAHLASQHNNANVLVFGGRQTKLEDAIKMFDEWINTPYEGGRHQARIEQIDEF